MKCGQVCELEYSGDSFLCSFIHSHHKIHGLTKPVTHKTDGHFGIQCSCVWYCTTGFTWECITMHVISAVPPLWCIWRSIQNWLKVQASFMIMQQPTKQTLKNFKWSITVYWEIRYYIKTDKCALIIWKCIMYTIYLLYVLALATHVAIFREVHYRG